VIQVRKVPSDFKAQRAMPAPSVRRDRKARRGIPEEPALSDRKDSKATLVQQDRPVLKAPKETQAQQDHKGREATPDPQAPQDHKASKATPVQQDRRESRVIPAPLDHRDLKARRVTREILAMAAGTMISCKGSTVRAAHGFQFPPSKDRRGIAERRDQLDPQVQRDPPVPPEWWEQGDPLDRLDHRDLLDLRNAAL
jgi:hypothetical protein